MNEGMAYWNASEDHPSGEAAEDARQRRGKNPKAMKAAWMHIETITGIAGDLPSLARMASRPETDASRTRSPGV